jgi:hypothetical protein
MKQLWEVIVAGVLGFLFIMAAAMVLSTILSSVVSAQDPVVAVREARLGEQNRSFNYPLRPQIASEDSGREEYEAYQVVRATDASRSSCAQTNMHLRYMLLDVAKHIARDPTLGYIYEGAIQAIHDSWCK